MPTTTPPQSAIYRTAERAVGGDLSGFLSALRGEGASYHRISSALQDRDVIVSYETVRSWCQRLGIEKEPA